MFPRNFFPLYLNTASKITTLLPVAMTLLTSCATLTKEQCRQADWHSLGYDDGFLGRSYSYFERHVNACKRADVLPDKDVWLAGHKKGARKYCEPQNAYWQGLKGHKYHNICEPDQHKIFVVVHSLGYQEYVFIDNRDRYARKIVTLESELDDKEETWAEAGFDYRHTQDERNRIREKIHDAREDYSRASDKLADFRRFMMTGGIWRVAGMKARIKVDRGKMSVAIE